MKAVLESSEIGLGEVGPSSGLSLQFRKLPDLDQHVDRSERLDYILIARLHDGVLAVVAGESILSVVVIDADASAHFGRGDLLISTCRTRNPNFCCHGWRVGTSFPMMSCREKFLGERCYIAEQGEQN